MREENERLRAEVTRLRALLGQACDGSGGAPPPAVAATGLPGSSPAPPTATLQQLQAASSGSLPDLLAPTVGRAPGLPLANRVGGSGGPFRPTAAARPLSVATLAELPSSASGTAPNGKSGLAAAPPKQVQGALNLFYRDLQAFAASVQLERVPADGECASSAAVAVLALLDEHRLQPCSAMLVPLLHTCSTPCTSNLLPPLLNPRSHPVPSPPVTCRRRPASRSLLPAVCSSADGH